MRRRVDKLADGPVLDRSDARPGQGGAALDDDLDQDQFGHDQPWGNRYRDERDCPARGIMLGVAIGAVAWILIGLAVLAWWS